MEALSTALRTCRILDSPLFSTVSHVPLLPRTQEDLICLGFSVLSSLVFVKSGRVVFFKKM